MINEVAPPGWGHTKAEKEKTDPSKPKSKIGGSAAAFKRALDDGRFKGLPGSKTKKEKTADMFKLMWSMKKKGDKPHYKPGTDKKYKKYQEEVEIEEKYGSWKKDVKDRDKDHKKNKKGGRRKTWARGGTEKLSDVNKVAERKSMQSVGGFRGVHGASRKSKSAQGPAGRIEYRRKSPADTPRKQDSDSVKKVGTFYKLKKRVEEESLDKPIQSMITQIKSRAKKY